MATIWAGSPWITATIADGAQLSAEANLLSPYKYCTVVIPTITSATISIQGAMTSGGTFYPVHGWNDADADGTVLVATTAGTGGITATFPLGGFQYVKVYASATQSGGDTFYLRGFN